jgi:hypothetical protein
MEQIRGLFPIRSVACCALPESVAIGAVLWTILGSCRRSPLGALRSLGHEGDLEIEARWCTEAEALPLKGVMNFDPEAVASWHGEQKTIPKRRF